MRHFFTALSFFVFAVLAVGSTKGITRQIRPSDRCIRLGDVNRFTMKWTEDAYVCKGFVYNRSTCGHCVDQSGVRYRAIPNYETIRSTYNEKVLIPTSCSCSFQTLSI
ncbi:uncharacterized protein LOC144743116 [Ciona intestinalis]